MFWVLQIRGDKDHTFDRLVPLGYHFPEWMQFESLCRKWKVTLPEGFQQEYFRPATLAIQRLLKSKNANGVRVSFILQDFERTLMSFQQLTT